MANKVSLKKDILTSGVLTSYYTEKDYPVDVVEINFELTRNTTDLERMSKTEIRAIFNLMLNNIRKILFKKDIGFGTLGIEIETGYELGEHIIGFRILITGINIKGVKNAISSLLEPKLTGFFGGTLTIKESSFDKNGLHIELIPLQLDLYTFSRAIERNKEDRLFYTDDLVSFILNGMVVLSKEDLLDPLFTLPHN